MFCVGWGFASIFARALELSPTVERADVMNTLYSMQGENFGLMRGDIVVNTEERAKQLSQPQTDAQVKPLKPGAKPPAATPASASAPATPDTPPDPKRPIRAVGPTFLPAH